MKVESTIREALQERWLPTIYVEKIRSQRTRSIELEIAERENQAEIQYTLLGIELKVGRRRFACPDLSTARYMRVFARVGCAEFAIPYDISKIPAAADELETAWQWTLLQLDETCRDRSSKSVSQIRSKLIRAIRDELLDVGAGDAMPQFDRKTRQGHS